MSKDTTALTEAIERYAEARARLVDATKRQWGIAEAERDIAETRTRMNAELEALTN